MKFGTSGTSGPGPGLGMGKSEGPCNYAPGYRVHGWYARNDVYAKHPDKEMQYLEIVKIKLLVQRTGWRLWVG